MAGAPKICMIQPELTKQICRGCLCSGRSMKRIHENYSFKQYFVNLSDIMVSDSDGLPPWLCWECEAQFKKYFKFRHKILQCHHMLLQLLAGCQNFSEKLYKEIESFAKPVLTQSMTTVEKYSGLDDTSGDFKEEIKIKNEIFNTSNNSDEGDNYIDNCLPEDIGFENYEVNLDATELTFGNELKTESCEFEYVEEFPMTESLPRPRPRKTNKNELNCKKISKHKKATKLSEDIRIENLEVTSKKGSRKFVELDPQKVRVIVLSAEQQEIQRRLESANEEYIKFPFKCTLCYKGFNYEQKLSNHMEKHSKARGKFVCTTCHIYMKTANSLATHQLSHSTRYECVACGKRVAGKKCILEHYATVHEANTPRYVCHLCQKISVNCKTHYAHMRNHLASERPGCDLCGKTFLNKGVLREHMMIHTGERNFSCSDCGKKFRTQTHVQQHALTHSDSRDFYCVECDMRFKSEHTLRQHLLNTRKHVDEALKHSCGECARRFTSRATLDSHVRNTHRKEKHFVCDVCHHACGTHTGLRMHIQKVHQGWKPERKHICHTCGKGFASKFVLTNHARTHTGERPFACSRCSSTFTQSAALRTHTKMVHLRLGRNAHATDIMKGDDPGT